jgi:hypothetical protein
MSERTENTSTEKAIQRAIEYAIDKYAYSDDHGDVFIGEDDFNNLVRVALERLSVPEENTSTEKEGLAVQALEYIEKKLGAMKFDRDDPLETVYRAAKDALNAIEKAPHTPTPIGDEDTFLVRRIGNGCCGMETGGIYEASGDVDMYLDVRLPNGKWIGAHWARGLFERYLGLARGEVIDTAEEKSHE